MAILNLPRVSVILCFLNAKRFLREAIDSVLTQTLTDCELLLVDDGSTDGSSLIAQEYVSQFPSRLRYLEHEGHKNLGLPTSRNVGLRDAKGVYVALLDSDDVWFPSKLEQQVAILDSHPEVALVYGSSEYWYSWTNKPEDTGRDFVEGPNVQLNAIYDPPVLLRLYLSESAASPPPSDLLFRRDAILRLGGFEECFDHPLTMYEDQAFLAKVLLHARVFVAENCWDRYRLHPESCCSVTKREGCEFAVQSFYLKWLNRYLQEQGVNDAEIWKSLREMMWRHHHPILAGIRRRGRRLFAGSPNA
jgi:glycosyltransferase involved in cell wall biosynthesis